MNNTGGRLQSLTKDCLKESINLNGRALFIHTKGGIFGVTGMEGTRDGSGNSQLV